VARRAELLRWVAGEVAMSISPGDEG
jgi:hypothetical protein